MAVDPQSVGVSPVESPSTIYTPDLGFGRVLEAEVGYYFDPLIERTRNAVVYGAEPEQGFDWRTSVPERHQGFESRYIYATNEAHASEITRIIDESLARRRTLDDAPGLYQLGAGILNPINALAIPLGGPVTSAGRVAIARTALRGGISAGAVEAAVNVGFIQPADPVQTYAESFLNAGSVALFGGAFAGGFSIPAARRQQAQEQMFRHAEALARHAERMTRIGPVSTTALQRMQSRELRPFGRSEDVEQLHGQLAQDIANAERELASLPAGSGEARLVQERIDQLRTEQQPYSDELFYRSLELEGVNPNDIYRPSAGADNFFINFVTNPFRRIVTGNFGSANNLVKGITVGLAGDGGTQLELHRLGQTDGPSVHQLAAREMGEFARANDEMIRLWAEDTSAPTVGRSVLSGVDVNVTDIARRAQRSGNTIEAWLEEMNRRRVFGEEMTDAQARAAEIMNRYFESWEQRLIDTGQLRTKENIGRQITRLEQEIGSLEARLAEVDAGRAGDGPALRAQLANRQQLLAEYQFELENPSIGGVEPYLPRYWNVGAVRRNRQQLANTLAAWYQENPYIFSYNERLKKWERVELATDPDSIARRVDETINNILGERSDAPVEDVFLGTGRAGHIRARQLNIPNRLVWDFIEHNPIALMRNYTARTAPQYHFRKKFGGSRADVVERMRTAMREAGQSEDKIQAAVRDFTHLYDRVAGSVIREPEAMNQKVATVLRDAASLTYLGGAGVAALGDAGKIVMDTELPVLARGLQASFDPVIRRAAANETRLAGAALEMTLGSAGMRIVDDQNFNFLNNARMDRVRNAFHSLNLLGPVTVLGKQFSGMTGAHMLIEYSQKLARGTASEFEVAYLARHGIDADTAGRIADAPWQTDPDSGLILANSDAWEGNYIIPQINNGRVTVVESNPDGSPVGKRVRNNLGQFTDVYVPAFYRPNEGGPGGTIYFDRDYIEGPMYERKAWTTPRMEGVTPLPDNAFPTPRAWSNFVMWHEIMHTRFSAEDLNLEPKSAAYENRINEMAMEAHRNSTQVARETAETFRAALNTHTANVIMAATPADKPIIMDGVIYIRSSTGARFGLKEDPNVPGYSRIENGLLALPLQFYSFTLANVNKTVGLMMQGAVRNRMMGVVAMMAMGYMISSFRTPDYIWDEMSPQDKFGRAFDMSGVAALYSDLFYTSLQTSLAFGGPNLTGGFMQPRFPQEPNVVDGITQVTGAASGWTSDMVRSAYTFASGDYGEGASQFINNLPFSNLWFLREDINQFGRYLSN